MPRPVHAGRARAREGRAGRGARAHDGEPPARASPGYRGDARVGKNSVDSQGNTLGSHESYWVEDRLAPCGSRCSCRCCAGDLGGVDARAASRGCSRCAVAALLLPIAILLALLAARAAAADPGARPRGPRPAPAPGARCRARGRAGSPGRARPARAAGCAGSSAADARSTPRCTTASTSARSAATSPRFLVTRTLYTGAGCAAASTADRCSGCAQRPPFLKALARIFPAPTTRGRCTRCATCSSSPGPPSRARRRLHLLMGDANMSRVGAGAARGRDRPGARGDRGGAPARLAGARASRSRRCARSTTTPSCAALELADGTHADRARDPELFLDRARRTALGGSGPTRDLEAARAAHVAGDARACWRASGALADRIDWLAKRRLVRARAPDGGRSRRAARPRRGAVPRRRRAHARRARGCASSASACGAPTCASTSSARAAARAGCAAHRVRELAPRERIETRAPRTPRPTRAPTRAARRSARRAAAASAARRTGTACASARSTGAGSPTRSPRSPAACSGLIQRAKTAIPSADDEVELGLWTQADPMKRNRCCAEQIARRLRHVGTER